MIPSVLIIGTGEYTTGYIAADKTLESDKSAGVVALSIFDLKRRGKVLDVGLCGVNGTKFPAIRRHMADNIGPLVYEGMDLSCSTYPDDATCDSRAYEGALDNFKAGDCAIVFTPDDTHFDIALACINKGLHVLITKPIVKSLEQHVILKKAAEKNKVLVAVEVHKRLDPFYADARDRIRNNDKMGSFQHMNAYMSQPKHQLETFKAWAGKSSDISYYLNSHHVDFAEWCLAGKSRAIRVTASASYGVARSLGVDTEDTITLSVVWENLKDSSIGTGLYTASWVAPVTDVHSQQRFFYMGSKGEIKCDQAHRGYNVSTDDAGYASCNPLFMKYEPTNGKFTGQAAYGFVSFEKFVDATTAINRGLAKVGDFDDGSLATVATTMQGTAILEAGRLSLDHGCRPFDIVYGENGGEVPSEIVAHIFEKYNN